MKRKSPIKVLFVEIAIMEKNVQFKQICILMLVCVITFAYGGFAETLVMSGSDSRAIAFPIIPLSDSDLSRICGGAIDWIAVCIVGTFILTGCIFVNDLYNNYWAHNTPQCSQPYDKAVSSSSGQCYGVDNILVNMQAVGTPTACPTTAPGPVHDNVAVQGPNPVQCQN
jgi:hypothetical protein